MKRFALLALLGFAITLPAQALQVGPLTTVYEPSVKSGVLTVRNSRSHPQTVQISVEKVVVVDGKETREPTTDLRILPATFKMEANGTQVARFIHQGDTSKEVVYRITVAELATDLQFDPTKEIDVQHLISQEFGWIWRPKGAEANLVAYRHDGQVIVENQGNATAQITSLVAGTTNRNGLIGYIYPDQKWVAPVEAQVQTISLTANRKDWMLEVK